jgi:DNA-binding MarR family transcriptional regulator
MSGASDFDGHVIAAICQPGRYSALHPEAWREIDLTVTRVQALLFISAGSPLSVTNIGTALGMRLGADQALVNRLDRLGLVSSAVHPRDRRQTPIELTPSCEAMLDRSDADSSERTRRLFIQGIGQGREAWLIALHEAVQVFSESENSA